MTETATGTSTEYPFGWVPAEEAAERYRRIAADRPMSRVQMPFGGETWVIHRAAAAKEMLMDRRFVRKPFRTGERVVPYFVEFPDFLRSTVQFQDPPEHTKLRRLVSRAMSPKAISRLRESAVAYANELIDAMIAKGAPAELVEDYALMLPIQMLSRLLGVPPEDHDKFKRWSSSTLAVAGLDEDQIATNMMELVVYMSELIDQRRAAPREDLLSLLAAAEDDEDELSNDDILAIALILIIAGFDNTANFICTGVLALLNNPAQRDLFLSDIEGLVGPAVEEVLRHGRFELGLPVQGGGGLVPFVATEDVVLDGQLVAAGEAVLIDPAATAHDGTTFEDDGRFDIRRENNHHLTLSHGLHHCMGAPLARMEMQIGLAELFRRIPDLQLAGTPVVNYDHLSQPITYLPVSW